MRNRIGQAWDGKPETFNFLGFYALLRENPEGYFTVLRQDDAAKRWQASCEPLKEELRRRLHTPI